VNPTTLPAINACLNGLATLLLLAGFIAIKSGKREVHIRLMLSATSVSAIFLCCYLYYHAHYGSTRFQGEGPVRTIYLGMLLTHVLLAATVPFFALRLIYLGWRGRWAPHRRLAKIAWPIWMYVSVTGVLIYLMLYQWFPPESRGPVSP